MQYYSKNEPETIKVSLWFLRETSLARQYSKLPFHKKPEEKDKIWIPKSIIEHTSKSPNSFHVLTLPLWFVEKNDL